MEVTMKRKPNTDRFDLEQKIMDCWGITEDLDDLLDMVDSTNMSSEKQDELSNTIIGLKTLYQRKFETMFSLFENVCCGIDTGYF
jgi:hypothetical protein